MGKHRKNQPGYTQGKDVNGRTIWVPDGSQSPNAGSTSGGSDSVMGDYFSDTGEVIGEKEFELSYNDASREMAFITNTLDMEGMHDDSRWVGTTPQDAIANISSMYAELHQQGIYDTVSDVADSSEITLTYDLSRDNLSGDSLRNLRGKLGGDWDVNEQDNTVSISMYDLTASPVNAEGFKELAAVDQPGRVNSHLKDRMLQRVDSLTDSDMEKVYEDAKGIYRYVFTNELGNKSDDVKKDYEDLIDIVAEESVKDKEGFKKHIAQENDFRTSEEMHNVEDIAVSYFSKNFDIALNGNKAGFSPRKRELSERINNHLREVRKSG